MKKNYNKPDILFESFALSVDIAGGCEVKLATPSANQCGVKFGTDVVFTEKVSGCEDFVVEDGTYNSLCYHVPTDRHNVFNS